MARKKVELHLDLDSKQAQKKVKDLNKELGNTEDELEDAESAGKRMARAIAQSADDMTDEIDATKRAVEALDRELGDIDADPREVVADLKRMGLTAEDIENDAEELASALRKIDDVNLHATNQGFDDVGQAVGRVGDETGRAKDTMHGFVGGAVGELPLIGEAMGPVAEGLGQLTEGALAGEISLRDMAKVIGPMAGITAGVMLLQKGLESVAETKAFNEEQISEWRDILDDLAPGLSAVNEQLQETEEITGRAGGIGSFFEGTKDITEDLQVAGVTYDEWVASVENGGEALELVQDKLRAHREEMVEARNEAQRNGETTIEYERRISSLDNAIEIAAETTENYSKTQEDKTAWDEWAAESTLATAEATEQAEEALDDHIDALEEEIDALEEAAEAQEELMDLQLEAADVVYALEDAEWALEDAVSAANEVYADAEATARDKEEADRAVAEAAQDVASASADAAESTALLAGRTFTAADRVDAMNTSLLNQASTLNGPQRQAVLRHIQLVNGIPDSVMTEINARLDRGDIAGAESLLNNTSRTRESAINAVANTFWANYALDLAARNRTAYIKTQAIGAHPSSIYNNAKGTDHFPGGMSWVGEEGPELVEMPRGAKVQTAAKSRAAMKTMGNGGGGNNNITIHMPAGARPSDVVKAQEQWIRRNGPR